MNEQSIVKLIYSIKSKFLLLAILIIMAQFFLITLSYLIAQVLLWLKALFLDDTINSVSFNPIIIILFSALFLSVYLIILFHAVISSRLTYDSFKNNSVQAILRNETLFNQPDPLAMIFRVLNWNLYRLYYVLFPLIIACGSVFTIFIITSLCFNGIIMLAGINIGIVGFLVAFTGLCLITGFIYALLCSLKNLVISLFGIECVICEPELPNKVIIQRSKKLSFINPINFLLYFLFFLFVLVMTAESLGFVFLKNYISIENITIFVILTILNIFFYVGLGYLKNALYIESLISKYNSIIVGDINRLNLELSRHKQFP